jgi:anti-sigma B factor antagonist
MSIFTTRQEADALLIDFEGPAGLNDFRNSALRDALYELVQGLHDPRIGLNMVKVDYLSSSGVAILVGLKRRVETRGGKLVLFNVQPIVGDLLKVMKLDRYFPFVDDEHAAIALLRPLSTL